MEAALAGGCRWVEQEQEAPPGIGVPRNELGALITRKNIRYWMLDGYRR
jgi:hypothetical protein